MAYCDAELHRLAHRFSHETVLLAAYKAVQSESFLTQKNKDTFFALLNVVEMQLPVFHIAVFYPLHLLTVLLLDMTD
jgi:hypothetical protein